MKLICRLLVVSLLFLSFQSSAGMIGTDQVATSGSTSAERMHVQTLLSRSDVANALQSMGVDPKAAADRVAMLTDDEVRQLSGKLDALPAGGTSGWAVAAVVLIVAFIIWWLWYRK
jgi:hypothetical protein